MTSALVFTKSVIFIFIFHYKEPQKEMKMKTIRNESKNQKETYRTDYYDAFVPHIQQNSGFSIFFSKKTAKFDAVFLTQTLFFNLMQSDFYCLRNSREYNRFSKIKFFI